MAYAYPETDAKGTVPGAPPEGEPSTESGSTTPPEDESTSAQPATSAYPPGNACISGIADSDVPRSVADAGVMYRSSEHCFD